ncbi:MAG: metal ABC transporter permease [Cytophagaceae bacterium]|nr:metal ABC transporter permease [Cytophagaceae bacterium]MDW8455280.1 metal ABC transporter permease [Cytophagaceae bacterium]
MSMWEDLLLFLSLKDPNVRYVVLGLILLSSSCALVGCFTFLRKRALSGDALAHSVLPGVCLAFIITGDKQSLPVLLGAIVFGWLSLYTMDYLKRNTILKEDTVIGLVLSVFFGIGLLLLSHIQHSDYVNPSGLDSILFGRAASLVEEDVWWFGITGVILVTVIFALLKEFVLICFDEPFARSISIPVKMLEVILTTLTVMAIVTGIQAVGVVLMAAFLITPAAAARYWTYNIKHMLIYAALISMSSSVAGAYVSYSFPKMPTAPWIVLVLSLVAFFSFLFSPHKGVWKRWMNMRNNSAKILEENILKTFYHLGERENVEMGYYTEQQLNSIRGFKKSDLKKGLRKLIRLGYVKKSGQSYTLTNEGYRKGERIVRLHRLWELYLSNHVKIAADHVHDDAETIEHIITPEIEQKLEELLKSPLIDPHQSSIPPSRW